MLWVPSKSILADPRPSFTKLSSRTRSAPLGELQVQSKPILSIVDSNPGLLMRLPAPLTRNACPDSPSGAGAPSPSTALLDATMWSNCRHTFLAVSTLERRSDSGDEIGRAHVLTQV